MTRLRVAITSSALFALLLGVGFAVAAEAPPLPAWLFPKDPEPAPGAPAAPLAQPEPDPPQHIPGSPFTFTAAQTRDFFGPADWRPDLHPPMPAAVGHGRRPDVAACATCHLTTGEGRPENASLAGQPAAYIVRQMADYRSGARRSSNPDTSARMVLIAKAITDSEIQEAASYFSSLSYRPWVRILESEQTPQTRPQSRMLLPVHGPWEALGHRIVETTEDLKRNLLRDPTEGFVAYVPVGSVGRGQALASTGDQGRTIPCAACHGADLRGQADVPGIAGRGPSYIARQLYDFQHGSRKGQYAAQMQPVVAKLTEDDIIDLAAYVASVRP
jgi:cytochrome c553